MTHRHTIITMFRDMTQRYTTYAVIWRDMTAQTHPGRGTCHSPDYRHDLETYHTESRDSDMYYVTKDMTQSDYRVSKSSTFVFACFLCDTSWPKNLILLEPRISFF